MPVRITLGSYNSREDARWSRQKTADSQRRLRPARAKRVVAPLLLCLSDVSSIIAAVFATAITSFHQLAIPGLLSGLLIMWFFQQRHYTARRGRWIEIKHTLTGVAVMAVINGWTFFTLRPQALWEVRFWAYVLAFIIFGRLLAHQLLRALDCYHCATLLVGPSETLEPMRAFVMEEHQLGYDIRDSVAVRSGDDMAAEIEFKLELHPDLGYVLIGLDGTSSMQIGRTIKLLDEAGVSYGLVPPVSNVPLLNFHIDRFLGCDFMVLQSSRPLLFPSCKLTTKRCVDIAGSVLGLILVSPVLLAIAATLYLQGGPILYRSRRLGHGGAVFSALKFRTMRPDAEQILDELLSRHPELRAEWQANYKLHDDPRTTRFGRFLRCTSFDELPQLINVLRGEMSLVGPRPLLLEEIPQHKECIHLYRSMLPGITGLWQVSGRNNLDYRRRIQLNNWYVNNWSLWHDLVILLKTILVVVRRRGVS